MAHPAHNVRFVGFDFHAAAAPIALLAAPQIAIDLVQRHRNARRQPGKRGYQTLAVRLSCRFKTQHEGNASC
jgi:hypothetical protein